LTLIGAIELLGDQLAMPAQNRVGLGSLRDFFSRLLAQFLTNLGQGLALGVTQLDTSFDLVTEDAIFSHQVFVTEQEFLIDRARDIGQQRFPIHVVLPPLFPID
jgi:hypothetical protein